MLTTCSFDVIAENSMPIAISERPMTVHVAVQASSRESSFR